MAGWASISLCATAVVAFFNDRVESGGPSWYYVIILCALVVACWSLYCAFEKSKNLLGVQAVKDDTREAK